MDGHWFSESQWQLPNENQYLALQQLFARITAEKHPAGRLETLHYKLVRQYHTLSREYRDLCLESESLRRPLSVSIDVPYTDVWMYKTSLVLSR